MVSTGGRPKVHYQLCNSGTKRDKIAELNQTLSMEEVCHVVKKKFKLDNNLEGMKLIDLISDKNGAEKLVELVKRPDAKMLSPEEALAFITESNITKHVYKSIRKTAIDNGHSLYPSIDKVTAAKQSTYPTNVFISETVCTVPLQDLSHHTALRLMTVLNLIWTDDTGLKLILKYGFDGTNAKSYRQKSSNPDAFCDSLFCSSLLPLRLVDKTTNRIYWSNPRPSSNRFCRPIKISFEKETAEGARREELNLQQQINELEDVCYNKFRISFEMHLTMIDGKICSALNESSSQTCFVCGSTISKLNDIEEMSDRPVNPDSLKYGFSVLHAHIRFMELFLNISYRIELRSWRASKAQKDIISEGKKFIQTGLRKELGVIVDSPTQGFGNTNDGNTAQRFFANIDIVSKVTGFNADLLNRLKVISSVISCQEAINPEAFRVYGLNTAMMYRDLYSWYYMPPSLHVILIHGHQIMEHLLLSIEMLSEEAQESNDKNIKKFRERHARKISREATNYDTFHRLLTSSDPVISLSRKLPKNPILVLNPEMRELLVLETSDIDVSEDTNENVPELISESDMEW